MQQQELVRQELVRHELVQQELQGVLFSWTPPKVQNPFKSSGT